MPKVKLGSKGAGLAKGLAGFLDLKKSFDDAIRQKKWEREKMLFASKEDFMSRYPALDPRVQSRMPAEDITRDLTSEERTSYEDIMERSKYSDLTPEDVSKVEGFIKKFFAQRRNVYRKILPEEAFRKRFGGELEKRRPNIPEAETVASAREALRSGTVTEKTPYGKLIAQGIPGYTEVFDPTQATGRKYVADQEYISKKDRITLEQNATALAQKGQTALYDTMVNLMKLEQGDEDLSIKQQKADTELRKLDLEIQKAEDSRDIEGAKLLQKSKEIIQKGIIERGKIAEKLVRGRDVKRLREEIYPFESDVSGGGRKRDARTSLLGGNVLTGPLYSLKTLLSRKKGTSAQNLNAVLNELETTIPQAVGNYSLEEVLSAIDRNEFMVQGKRVKLDRKTRNLLKQRVRELYLQ